MSVRVVAPCRLHFGLLHVPVPGLTHWPDGTPVRKFGGVGLMVEAPSVSVSIEPAREFSAEGPLSDRAMGVFTRLHQRLRGDGIEPVHLVASGPPEHVGLGVGTALSLAVAGCVIGRSSVPDWAKQTGRGKRSGIGMFGFERGGLLLDAGKENEDDTPTLHARIPFPEDWRMVLVRPQVEPEWHGDRERSAFDRPRDPATARATTDRLCEIAFGELMPAARAKDFPSFAASAYDYNRLAGEPFTEDQDGPYSGPQVTELIETLRTWGVAGVGQSSWGPTVFAFAEDESRAADLANGVRTRWPDLADVTVARACNRGATVASTD